MLPVIDGLVLDAPASDSHSRLLFVKSSPDKKFLVCTFTKAPTDSMGKFASYLIELGDEATFIDTFIIMHSKILQQLETVKENFFKRLHESGPTGRR